MHVVQKYKDIENKLPNLPKVLLNTIQSDVLEIKNVQKDCEKYLAACEKIPDLVQAEYVVYSKYINKNDHEYEKFVFLGKDGAEVCNVSGKEMELYGILTCTSLDYSDEYKALNN